VVLAATTNIHTLHKPGDEGWGGIELTGTKINLSPNDACVASEVHGARIFLDSNGLGKRGARLQALGLAPKSYYAE
jgi:hypothetical protein